MLIILLIVVINHWAYVTYFLFQNTAVKKVTQKETNNIDTTVELIYICTIATFNEKTITYFTDSLQRLWLFTLSPQFPIKIALLCHSFISEKLLL